MPRVLLFIYPTCAQYEVAVTLSLLRDSHDPVTFSLTKEPVPSEEGVQLLPHLSLEEVEVNDYDALIIPGGDMEGLKDAAPLFELIRALYEQKKYLAAICSGPYLLARAGLLQDRPYTVTFSREQRRFLGCFNEAGFSYQPAIQDDAVLTAQGHAFVAFGLRLEEQLSAQPSESARAFYTGAGNAEMEEDTRSG